MFALRSRGQRSLIRLKTAGGWIVWCIWWVTKTKSVNQWITETTFSSNLNLKDLAVLNRPRHTIQNTGYDSQNTVPPFWIFVWENDFDSFLKVSNCWLHNDYNISNDISACLFVKSGHIISSVERFCIFYWLNIIGFIQKYLYHWFYAEHAEIFYL